MDKITKIQEVNSFIINFDNKFWNEVILKLTIIGIRYIKNFCLDYFKWKIEDLSIISDQLKRNQFISSINYKTFFDHSNNNLFKHKNYYRNENNIYNYNYSNKTFFKKDKKYLTNKKNNNKSKSLIFKSSIDNSNYNNKKYLINGNINNESNNSILFLSNKENHKDNTNNKNTETNINIKHKKMNGQNYIKNPKYNNKNKILSLNKEAFNTSDINVVISDFPFCNKNIIENYYLDKNNNSNGNKKEEENRLFDTHKNFNKSALISNNFKCIGNEIKNKTNYLINEIKKDNELLIQSSRDFISELRKMSHSNDKMKKSKSYKKGLNSNLNHSKSLNSISPIFIEENNKVSPNYQNNFCVNRVNINNNFNKKNEININYDKINNKEKFLPKSDNRNYLNKTEKENYNINFNYNSHNSLEDINKKQIINKYLKNPNYKNKKIRSCSTDDLSNRNINNNKTNLNYDNNETQKTDFHCHYYYESKH